MSTVIAAAQQQLILLQHSLSTIASSAPVPLANPSDPPLDQVQWAYDGSTCWANAKGSVIQLYIEAFHEELLAQGIICPVRQGHYMSQLLKNPLRQKLLDCISSDMPEVAAPVAAGRAVLTQHYAFRGITRFKLKWTHWQSPAIQAAVASLSQCPAAAGRFKSVIVGGI